MVAYKSAFLRAHYPAEFMAAVISNGGGYYSTFGYLSEARRMGLAVLPPHINLSGIKYTGDGREIRAGLMQLHELGGEAKEAIVRERSKNGPFSSFEEFLDRVGARMHLQDVRVLVKAGCFDPIEGVEARPLLMWKALAFYSKERTQEQKSLLGGPGRRDGPDAEAPGRPPPPVTGNGYPPEVIRRHEIETMGFPFSYHPLDRYSPGPRGHRYVRAADLRDWAGKEVTVMGWRITAKTVHTRTGEAMQFTSFEDQTGIYEAVLFPRVYHRYCHLLSADRAYILRGRVEETFGAVSLNVKWIGFPD
jgi:error-prone DNA polymerase